MGRIENSPKVRVVQFTVFAVLLMIPIILVGCSQSSAAEQKVEDVSEVVETTAPIDKKEELTTIGSKTDDSLEIQMDNAIGKPIDSVTVSLSTDVDFATPVFDSATDIGPFEEVLMYFVPSDVDPNRDVAEGVETQAAVGDLIFRNLYNVQLVFNDGSVCVLHAINLEEIGAFKLCMSADGIVYVDYESNAGESGSTLEYEKAIIAAEQAAIAQAEAEAAAAAQAEADAAQAAAAAQNAAPQYNYNYGSGATSGGGSQSADQCVDDLVFN